MTVKKKHRRPDNTLGDCEAQKKCRYGAPSEHVFYDSSTQKFVLDPDSSQQKQLNRLTVEELDKRKEEFLSGKEERKEYKKYLDAYHEKKEILKEHEKTILKAYPLKEQGFEEQLRQTEETSDSVVGSFKIKELPNKHDEYSEEDKQAAADLWADMNEAESKYRSVISSYIVAQKK